MIVLDVGNSSVTMARIDTVGERPDITPCFRLGGGPTPTGDAGYEDLLRAVTDVRRENEAVVVVSVVPAVTEALLAGLAEVRVVDHRDVSGFAVGVDDATATGADRFANMAAAAAMGWSSALVVDVGTATTFDVLRDGVFVGGLIAPGPAMAAEALGDRAARLTPVPFAFMPLVPGRGTSEAMSAGSFHVGIQGVSGVLISLRRSLGDPPVVLTGGLAGLVADPAAGAGLPDDLLVDQDWTLKGAALLAG